jgi:hypothetical protein
MHADAVARALTRRGFDVVAACAVPDLRGRPDDELLAAATADGRAVVTENVRDFAPLATSWAAAGRPHGGIVFTAPTRFSRARAAYPGDLIAALESFLAAPPIHGEAWIWWL